MLSILDALSDDLASWLQGHRQPAFRARQIRQWLFDGRAEKFAEMTNLPVSLRAKLETEFSIWTTDVVHHCTAKDGTEKLLLQLPDAHTIESVLLRDGDRRTICISSQVGCAMGCVFCASGLGGVKRNLSTSEILQQMLRLQRLLPPNERLSHIVMMGMGEPLANLDQLLPALDLARHPDGFGISARRVTISTVGIPTAIRRLAQQATPYQLAVSLHAPNDDLRNRLVPVNRSTGLGPILDAADDFFRVSGRRLTFEYVLLGGVNDRPEHAQELVSRLRGRKALLNVIPYNPVADLPYKTPRSVDVRRFCETMEQAGITVQVRQRKGNEIEAACGQLRRTHASKDVLSLDA